MRLRVSDSQSDLDSIRNSYDVFLFFFWGGRGTQVELVFVWLQVSVFDLGKVAEIICVQWCYWGPV